MVESEPNGNMVEIPPNPEDTIVVAQEPEQRNSSMVEVESAADANAEGTCGHLSPLNDKECSDVHKTSQAKEVESGFKDIKGSGDSSEVQLTVTVASPDVMAERMVPGDYQLVTWDLDTTGKRLTDDICHIAAYYPDKIFSQYVMPHRNPGQGAKRSFGICVVNIGRYRMLKNIRNGKILRTKSEISALNDFIHWLEEVNGKEGVVLICHETQKVNIPILLEALLRFSLEDSFFKIVKGFGNSYTLAEKMCEDIKHHTLRSMCKKFLKSDQELDHAAGRAKSLYAVLQNMFNGSVHFDNIQDQCFTPDAAKGELQILKGILQKQGTLRPIFQNQLQKSLKDRQRASALQRLVAEGGLNYEMLTARYKEGGIEAVIKCLKERVTAKDDGIDELSHLMEDHFEPREEAGSKMENKNLENKPKADITSKTQRAPRGKETTQTVETFRETATLESTTKAVTESFGEAAPDVETVIVTEQTSDAKGAQ